MQSTRQRSWMTHLLQGVLALYAIGFTLYLILRFTQYIESRWFDLVHNVAPYLFLPILVSMVLTLLLRWSRLLAIYSLLLLVGVLWLGGHLGRALTNTPANTDDVITVLTYNVYPDNANYAQAVALLLEQAPDILLLQEIAGDTAMLEAAYDDSAIYTNPNDITHGIFTDYPIRERDFIDLDGMLHQRVVLDVAGQTLVVYNVHLYMPLNEQEQLPVYFRYDETRRNRQIADLLAHIANEEHPVIVAGDFNMSEFSPIYHTIANRLTDSYRRVNWQLGNTWSHGASEDLGAWVPTMFRLDYIWHSERIITADAQVLNIDGSDHLPMIATLQLPSAE